MKNLLIAIVCASIISTALITEQYGTEVQENSDLPVHESVPTSVTPPDRVPLAEKESDIVIESDMVEVTVRGDWDWQPRLPDEVSRFDVHICIDADIKGRFVLFEDVRVMKVENPKPIENWDTTLLMSRSNAAKIVKAEKIGRLSFIHRGRKAPIPPKVFRGDKPGE
jgi:hypothetical protein